MAEGTQSSDERTEAATARHLSQAREEGQVALSREVASFVSLAAVLLVLTYQTGDLFRLVTQTMAGFLAREGDLGLLGLGELRLACREILIAALATLAAAALAGGAAVLVQTDFLLHPGSLRPNFSRVSPRAGLRRMIGLVGFVELVKSLAKVALLLAAGWVAIGSDVSGLAGLPWQDPRRVALALGPPLLHLAIAGVLVQGIIAGADVMWVRFRHARDLRMSKQDIREELKDTEGNPHVKARIRRIRLVRARRRMMACVPTATVVVTNPTHFAVALAYDRVTNPAPRIVAKGTDSLAARIRGVAAANAVPIVANPPLARALYQLELDTEIPAAHYKAVAEIIAYVWRLRTSEHAVS